MKKIGLFVVPTDYDSLKRKGVLHLIDQRNEDGYLDEVVTIHPFAVFTRTIRRNAQSTIHEFAAPDLANVPQGSVALVAWRIAAWIRRAIYLAKLVGIIRRLAEMESASFVRAHDANFCGLVAWLATRRPRIPFCISVHSDYDNRYKLDGARGAPVILGSRALAKRLESFLYSRADLVLVPFPRWDIKVIEAGAVPGRVRKFPHGVDMSLFHRHPAHDPLADLGLPPSTKTLVFAGRLSNENYVDEMLSVARRLAHRSDFKLILVGGGNEEERLRATVEAEPELRDVVLLTGFRPHGWVCDLRRQATVSLCLMGGYSLIEACAAARPVVAFDTEWHGQLVRTGDSGFLIPEGDDAQVADAVSILLDNAELASKMGTRAQQLAIEHYDLITTRNIRRKVYDELISMSLETARTTS